LSAIFGVDTVENAVLLGDA